MITGLFESDLSKFIIRTDQKGSDWVGLNLLIFSTKFELNQPNQEGVSSDRVNRVRFDRRSKNKKGKRK